MKWYVVRRVLGIFPVALLVTLVVFLLVAFVPNAAQRASGEYASRAEVHQAAIELGLNKPIVTRYIDYLGNLFRGNFGKSVSIQPGQSVTHLIGEAVPVTLSLALVAMAMVFIFGFLFGAIVALRAGTWVDRGISAVVAVALAVPGFVIGPILISLLAVKLRIFPAIGYTKFGVSPYEWLRGLVLPAIALGSVSIAELARQVRAALVGELDESYIRTAYSKGLPTRTIVGKHAMKNAATTAITVLGLQVGRIIGGSVIVENIFGLSGVGNLLYNATFQSDFPVLQAMVVLTALVVLLVNLLTDLSYLYFDPKLRYPTRA